MSIQHAAVILPCHSWDDFPTHLGDEAAAELLSAWTALWHPAILAATGKLPGWHQAEEPPDPAAFEGELILVPPVSRARMPGDWCDRLAATAPKNPLPVATVASRAQTVATMLAAAGLSASDSVAASAADFYALGFAYLQVELLTRAMRYSTVLDNELFESAAVAAAKAALDSDSQTAHDELSRAFDLLADARNHVYSVDFYVVDIALLANSTLGEALRAKLAARHPTNVLVTGEQLDRVASDHPDTLAELKQAVDAGTAGIVGGAYRPLNCFQSPEGLLANLLQGQEAAKRNLDREFEIFGQYETAFFHLLPEVLRNAGFRGVLHTSFDGGQVPRAEQRKSFWGPHRDASIEALSVTPLDASRPETWLKLAERIADVLAHDHVATLVLAAWPGAESEFFDDLRRVARFGNALGRLITLDEYFRVTREPDDWTTFNPREYPAGMGPENAVNAISTHVDAFRDEVRTVHRQIGTALAEVAGLRPIGPDEITTQLRAAINPWSFECNLHVGVDALMEKGSALAEETSGAAVLLPEVLGCGFAALTTAIESSRVPLVEELTLRNERLELIVSQKTGGIQSLRLHRDRSTRVSQRLVFHHQRGGSMVESQMVADSVRVTRNDSLVGEITSTGRLTDGRKDLLARYTQRVRVVRGLEPVIVDVEIDPQQLPEGDVWHSYYGSRLAWVDDALAIRRGVQWGARETERERIESPEFVEIDDVTGKVTCFALGLPFHRRSAPNWLDTLLVVAGEERRRFQFAIGLDQPFPTRGAVSTCTVGESPLAEVPSGITTPRGWFLHLAARNLLITHVEPLPAPSNGVRLRILETEGRETRCKLSAFRPIVAARRIDFRATPIEVLSLDNDAAQIDVGPHRWIQVEVELASG